MFDISDEPAVIPGMGPEDKVETLLSPSVAQIPGLDFDSSDDRHRAFHKKVCHFKKDHLIVTNVKTVTIRHFIFTPVHYKNCYIFGLTLHLIFTCRFHIQNQFLRISRHSGTRQEEPIMMIVSFMSQQFLFT